MIDVSVIIISYNTKRILHDCLESVFKQSKNVELEVIVVDNASDDNSQDMIKSEFPSVILIENKQNLGFSRANNLGIRRSQGRYVCLINSDVIILQNCLQSLILFMDKNPRIGMSGPKILNSNYTLQPSCRRFPSLWNNLCQALWLNKLFPRSAFFSEPFMRYWAHDTERRVDVISGCFWVLRRKGLETVGLLDEDFFIYGEDIDWCKRFNNAGWDVVFYPRAEAIHFGGASSSHEPVRFYIEMQRADLQYWAKHHGRLAQLCYSLIILLRHLLRVVPFAMIYLIRPKNRAQTFLKLQSSISCIRWLLSHITKQQEEVLNVE